MNETEFRRLAQAGYQRIPLCRRLLADRDTPLSAYLKLAAGPRSYLLESVQGGEKWGRYSIIGLPAREWLTVTDGQTTVHQDDGHTKPLPGDPLAAIGDYATRLRVPQRPDLPRFTGGLVGYFGYDTVRYIEPRLAHNPNSDPLGTPDIFLLRSEEVAVFDNLAGRIYLITHVDPREDDAHARGIARLDALEARLRAPLPAPSPPLPGSLEEADFTSLTGREAFEAAVERARRYIIDGDAMQIVLSQRLVADFPADPLDLYRALRATNPSPYMYFLDLGGFHIVGSSPEILVRLEDGEVTVRPIAGTRRRGRTEAEDRALEAELLSDPKEIAEHVMLIDLGRNDVGRVAEIGSVRLTEKMVIERYSHVMHIVSNVTGRLRPGLDALDVLRATFPAGTVSGAPKVRAMEIIDELEPVKRGIYAGAVGYLGWSGNMDTAIAIRTAVVKDGRLHLQAGAGLVYDSQPELEWKETMNKARAVIQAAHLACAGVDRGEDC